MPAGTLYSSPSSSSSSKGSKTSTASSSSSPIHRGDGDHTVAGAEMHQPHPLSGTATLGDRAPIGADNGTRRRDDHQVVILFGQDTRPGDRSRLIGQPRGDDAAAATSLGRILAYRRALAVPLLGDDQQLGVRLGGARDRPRRPAHPAGCRARRRWYAKRHAAPAPRSESTGHVRLSASPDRRRRTRRAPISSSPGSRSIAIRPRLRTTANSSRLVFLTSPRLVATTM